MPDRQIFYKYRLQQDFSMTIPVIPDADVATEYIELKVSGKLTIKEGYRWDGPSGPTKDTSSFMRGAPVHDVLYQLMREGHLDRKRHRKTADRLMKKLCREDGMNRFKAWYTQGGAQVRQLRRQACPAQGARSGPGGSSQASSQTDSRITQAYK
jgi:hypothetical protein